MLQTRSNVLLVAQVNTVAGGSVVVISNSSNIFITNTSLTVMVQNSAGWVVNASSTILNSAGWIVSVANTGGTVFIGPGTGLIGTMNIIAQGTGASTNIINSAGWVLSIANTSGIKTFATLETAQMSSNGVALTAGYAVIAASGTDNTIVAAVATKKIRVLAFNMISQVGVNARFQSGTGASNLLTGTYFISSNGGLVAGYNPMGWFESSGNNLLNLKLSAATSIGGSLTYLEI